MLGDIAGEPRVAAIRGTERLCYVARRGAKQLKRNAEVVSALTFHGSGRAAHTHVLNSAPTALAGS